MGMSRCHGQLQLGHLLGDVLGCLGIGLDRERWRLFENQEQHAAGDRERDPGKQSKEAPTQPWGSRWGSDRTHGRGGFVARVSRWFVFREDDPASQAFSSLFLLPSTFWASDKGLCRRF